MNRNEIIAVSDKAYEFLEQEQAGVDCEATEEVFAELEALREVGYLSGNKVKEIRHGSTDMLEMILGRNMRKITIQITQDCNFRCSYCAYTSNDGGQRKHSKKSISKEMGKKAIMFFYEHSVDCDNVDIGFYGGEPLLELELLKELTLFAKDLFDGRNITFAITTNGTLLTDEAVEFLSKYKFSVLLSIDGVKEVHDKNRIFAANSQGTFDSVEKRISHIHDKYPEFFKDLSINMVMDPANDFNTLTKFFEHPIFNKLRIQTTLIDDSMLDKPNSFSDDYIVKSTYNKFLSKLCLLNRFPYDNLLKLSQERLTSDYQRLEKEKPRLTLPQQWAPAGPCVPGELRAMVTVDGKLLPCERVSETSDCMIIGDIENGFYMEKIKDVLNIGALTAEQCKDCFAISACGMCAKDADDNGCLSGKKKLEQCQSRKRNFYYQLREMVLLKEASQLY